MPPLAKLAGPEMVRYFLEVLRSEGGGVIIIKSWAPNDRKVRPEASPMFGIRSEFMR